MEAMPQLRLLALWFSKVIHLESIEGLDEAASGKKTIVGWVCVFEEGSLHSESLEVDLQTVKQLMPFLGSGWKPFCFHGPLASRKQDIYIYSFDIYIYIYIYFHIITSTCKTMCRIVQYAHVCMICAMKR